MIVVGKDVRGKKRIKINIGKVKTYVFEALLYELVAKA